MLKKIWAILTALVMAFGCCGALAENAGAFPDELIVGHTTITKGDFFTEMFGNDTADIDVRALLHGYNLINWDQNQGVYRVDESVVENVLVAEDALGDKTYFFGLYDDLCYSDGTPITAWDYAFSLLLMMSPEIEQIGGKIYRAQHLLGYKDYITGAVPYLSGVGVLDDHQIAITLDHEFLPYFFELGLFLTVPYPISEIAPGCKVYAGQSVDMGNGYGYGIRIGNADETVEEPIYTAELLEKTILDPETGYNSHPQVTSGPYRMVSWDAETGLGHYEINPYFKGVWYEGESTEGLNTAEQTRLDPDGNEYTVTLVKPTIEKIAFREVDNDEVQDLFARGELHLWNKAMYGPVVDEMMGGGLKVQPYPRIGLAFLTFTYEWPTVYEKEVRQAIAWCMDREQMTKDYCGDHGQVVNGYYGIEQWEYLICTKQIPYPIQLLGEDNKVYSEEELAQMAKRKNIYAKDDAELARMTAAWEMLTLDNLVEYTVDEAKANQILDAAGWTLNKDGQPYDPEKDQVRCKMIDDQLVCLELKMMYPAGNHIVDTIQENFIDHLNAAGITLELVPEEMEQLLKVYYREAPRTTDLVYLGTDFHVIVDPAITYSTDETVGHKIWNNTYSDDEELYWRAVEMRKTEPGDSFDYVAKWISFQERYNEVLPTIPVYSNIYYDFMIPELQNYFITQHVTWSQAIVEAYFGEATEMTDEEAEAEDDHFDF